MLRNDFRSHHAHGERPRLVRQPEPRSHSNDETTPARSGGRHHSLSGFPHHLQKRGGELNSPRFFVSETRGKKAGKRHTFSHSHSDSIPIKIMSVNIEMPKLSDTMTEGTLVKWHKQVGDTVEIGDIIAEVETDKATMEMEAFDEGVLTEILIKQGEKAPIGSILAVLDGESGPAATDTPAAAPAPHPSGGCSTGCHRRSSKGISARP